MEEGGKKGKGRMPLSLHLPSNRSQMHVFVSVFRDESEKAFTSQNDVLFGNYSSLRVCFFSTF